MFKSSFTHIAFSLIIFFLSQFKPDNRTVHASWHSKISTGISLLGLMGKKKTTENLKLVGTWFYCSVFGLQSPVFTLINTIFWLKARRKERIEMFVKNNI